MPRRLMFIVLLCFLLAACSMPAGGQSATTPEVAVATAAATPVEQAPAGATSETAQAATVAPTEATTAATAGPVETEATTSQPAETETAVEPAATADTVGLDDPARLAQEQPLPRDQTALVEAYKNTGDLPDVARTTPLEVAVGDVESFWVTDAVDDTNYVVTATLRYAGPVVLMYVDNAVEVDQSDIDRSAKQFEEQIYPRNRELFGSERSPGVDGDPRLTVLNTPVRGAGGYFSSADSVVKAVNRFSNEREMFVIGIDSYPIGTESYAATLAHEFQHMIEWEQARRSPSWFNEGMSTLAEDLNGFVSQGAPNLYLENPDVQLTNWSSDASQTGEHYGTSQLFMRYVHEHYAGEEGLAELIREDAGNNPEVFATMAARKRPDIKSFADLYADWAVANVVNSQDVGDGRYAYELLQGRAALTEPDQGAGEATVNQFGVDYLGTLEGPLSLSFDGSDRIGLTGGLPVEGRYMWWSKRGDDTVSTLTRAFDLSSVQGATLQFKTWYEIELDWDYAFVSVSTDEGRTWTTLQGTTTTTEDPQGQNLGNGITGVSGAPGVEPEKGTRAEWIDEQMDLTPFAGKQILLRFTMVQDASYNAQGILLDDIRIPEINYRDTAEEGDAGWESEGFVRTTGELAQQWQLRLVRTGRGEVVVEKVEVDARGRADVTLQDGERGILAVIAATPLSSEPASYSYEVSRSTNVTGGVAPSDIR